MAKDKRRMAQNRARKKARDAVKKNRKAHQANRGGRVAFKGYTRGEIARSPIHIAFVGDTLFTQGIGHVLIARQLSDGRIAAGVFLVDVYCLGVKNAFLMVQSTFEFENAIQTRFDANDRKTVAPAYARKLIDDSIAYARDLGFEPHPDFRDASVVLGDIDPTECTEEFTFGCEGKPYYISGPNDSATTARRIVAQLTARCGLDGFHYIVGSGDPGMASALGPDTHIIDEDGEERAFDGE